MLKPVILKNIELEFSLKYCVLFVVFVRPGSDGKAELVILDHGLYQPLETRYAAVPCSSHGLPN